MLMETSPSSRSRFFTFFLVLLTFMWLVLDTLGTLAGTNYVFIAKAAPSILLLFILLMLFLIKKNDRLVQKPARTNLFDPVMLYAIYLFCSLISLILAISPKINYFVGFGYLGAYIVAFLITGLLYSLLQNIPITSQGENPLCYAAYLASAVLLIATIFALAFTGFKTGPKGEYMEAFFGASGIGLLAMCVMLYPLAYRWTVCRGCLFVLATLLVFVGGSRTALISIPCACLALLFIKSKKLPIVILALIFGLLIISPKIYTYMQEDVFLVHDKYRGLDELSGRIAIWKYSWKKIGEHPFLGNGFRMSDLKLYKEIGISSAHNAYLTSLLETGAIGTTIMLLAVLTAYWRLWNTARRHGDKTSLFFFGILSGLLLFGMGERFLVNIGNPTSMLVIFALFQSRMLPTPEQSQTADVDSGTVGTLREAKAL